MKSDRKLLLGGVISLLLHVGLLYLIIAPQPRETAPDQRRMMVWLTPQPAPLSEPAAPPPPPLAKRPASAPPRLRQTAPSPLDVPAAVEEAVASAPAADEAGRKPQDPPADPFATAPASVPGKFDVNAAMKSARKLATAKSSKDDPPVAQIYDKPLYGLPSESPLGTAVARAARPDCKNIAQGTGLLALVIVPVLIMTDKKDSGCKW